MKIWIRTLVSITLALLLGYLLPMSWIENASFIETISLFMISIGKYLLFPLIFFSFTIRFFDLLKEKIAGKIIKSSILYIVATTLAFALLGTGLAYLLDAIPIEPNQEAPLVTPSALEFLNSIFPANQFTVFFTEGHFLLPLVVLSIIIAFALRTRKDATRPIAELFDSFSTLFNIINSWWTKYSFIGLFFITLASSFAIRQMTHLYRFGQLITLYLVISAILLFIAYPLVIYFTTKNKNPYKILFGMMTPLFASLLAGDLFYTAPLTLIHNEKNLKIDQKINVATTSFALLFGRAGTAFVTSSSLLLIMNSYTSLTYLSFSSVLLITLLSFLLSFFTGAFHRQGIIASIFLISTLLKTENNEYITLVGIAPILFCFATFIDLLNNTTMTYIINSNLKKEASIKASAFL